jgi:Zn-dependent peptidase ImmA (M78 family)/transcriptional regulator with XRE-family HTH domain
MTLLDPVTVGRRVAEARGRAGLTQAEMALRISMNRPSLAKIETGARNVSALELARIADAVGERIEWFVEEAPAAIVSRRNVAGPGEPSPAIDDLVERISRNVEFVAKHDDQLSLVSSEPFARPASVDDVEHAAGKARQLLGLDDAEPAHELARRAAAIGVLTFSIDLGVNAADGASIILEQGGVVVVNGTRRVGRRRLTCAHELGHHLFADEYTVDWRVSEQNSSDQWESLLDRFARAVLLPASGLRTTWHEHTERGEDLRTIATKVASRFRVDMSTLARRLLELGVANRTQADQVRQVRTTKADIVEFNLVICEELDSPTLPRPYIEAVLRLFRRCTISAARATDLLLDTWDESDLPALPELPENSIWQFTS